MWSILQKVNQTQELAFSLSQKALYFKQKIFLHITKFLGKLKPEDSEIYNFISNSYTFRVK